MLHAMRLISAVVVTLLVIAIWTVPTKLNLLWLVVLFVLLGLPGSVATLVIMADNQRRTDVS